METKCISEINLRTDNQVTKKNKPYYENYIQSVIPIEKNALEIDHLSFDSSTSIKSINSIRKKELCKETVLIMQGGGSLGAYECGVYKVLEKHNIKFDIVAGTSIGAINASIIAGTKTDTPALALEDFWYSLAENSTSSYFSDELRSYYSSMYAAIFGNPNVFIPIWLKPFSYYSYINSNYIYDLTPLKNKITEYIDFEKITTDSSPRLILTATDIQKGELIKFDSNKDIIDLNTILGCAGFPFYGIKWTRKDDKYLWDGALESNTPLKAILDSSPKINKLVYMINLFPRVQSELPKNMLEVWHRARDIIYSDKTRANVEIYKSISEYIFLLKEMNEIISNNESRLDFEAKFKFKEIQKLYNKLAVERGAILEKIIRIERTERIHFLFEDVDFSLKTIKKLIKQGEQDAELEISKQKCEKPLLLTM